MNHFGCVSLGTERNNNYYYYNYNYYNFIEWCLCASSVEDPCFGTRRSSDNLKFSVNIMYQISGEFAKLRRATINLVMSVRPSVHLSVQMEQHWTDFHEIWYLKIFRKSVENVYVSWKSDKNKRYFTWRPIYILYHISLIYSWNEVCCRQVLLRKSKHTFCVQYIFFFENDVVYENM